MHIAIRFEAKIGVITAKIIIVYIIFLMQVYNSKPILNLLNF